MTSLLQRVEQMLTVLQENVDGHCPTCGSYDIPEEHAPNCALAALLAEVRAEIQASEVRQATLASAAAFNAAWNGED